MSATESFFDSNVLAYLLSDDAAKADRAEGLLLAGGTISVQVLNEFALVARRKHALSWDEVRLALSRIRTACKIESLTEETHDLAIHIAERYGYRVYDSAILAAGLLAGCITVYTEDMHDGQVVEGALTIRNPFR